MNKIINTFLLAEDKFMPKTHLRQPRFTYSASGPFTKNKERIKKIIETGDSRYICQNELDKACFQHNIAFGNFKDLNKTDKALLDKAFDIAKIQNMMDTNMDLLQWFVNVLIKNF